MHYTKLTILFIAVINAITAFPESIIGNMLKDIEKDKFFYIKFCNPTDSTKTGIKDCFGIEIIPPIYDHIQFLNEPERYIGFYHVDKIENDGSTMGYVFDLEGNQLFQLPKYKKGEIQNVSPYISENGKLFFSISKTVFGFVNGEGTLVSKYGILDINGNLCYPISIDKYEYSIHYENDTEGFYLKECRSKNGRKKILNIKLIDSPKYNILKAVAKNAKRICDEAKNNPPIFETTHIENNGFCWIELSKGYGYSNIKGAITIDGDTIIPFNRNCVLIKFRELSQGMTCFEARSLGQKGIYSLQGSEIVPMNSYEIQYLPVDKIGGLFRVVNVFSLKVGIYNLNGKELVPFDGDYNCDYKSNDCGNGIGYLAVEQDDRYGAYDIYGNCIVPLGTKGNRLYYGKKGFYFADDRKYLGIQIDEYGAADYSLREKWDRQAREKEEERRRKKEQRRNFWTNFGNALAQSALGYLGMQSQTMMPMTGAYNTYSMPSFSSNQNIGPLAQQMSQTGYFNNVYQELMFTSMAQVQQQEMWEYNQARQGALAMGKDLTLDEWRCQQGAAIQALKEQGIDIIAEQNERNRQNSREWRESLSQDSKDRLQRIKDYNQMKYGTSSSSSSSSSTNRKSGQLSHSLSQGNIASNYNSTSYPQTSTSRNNNSVSNANTQTKPNDSHQQYKNGNKNVRSSDYTYIQRVTLYRQDGNSFRVAKQNAELYEKGATEYIKIGGTFFPAQNPGKVTEYRKRIVYGGVGLYYN